MKDVHIPTADKFHVTSPRVELLVPRGFPFFFVLVLHHVNFLF